jgi:RNA polymerase sigma factor for flagellar operon FliA
MYWDLKDSKLKECQEYVDEIVSKLMHTMRLPTSFKEEFLSAGMLGLVEAADRFVPEKGNDFKAFAFFRVRGAVIDYVRSTCELNGSAYKILKALEASQELQEAAQDKVRRDSFSSANSKLERIVDYLTKSAISYKLVSSLQGQREEATRKDTESPEVLLSKKREAKKVRDSLATLSPKERLIIEQYYFNDVNLSEVAKEHAGLSKSWVSRLHDKAIEKLRDHYIKNSTPADLDALEVRH